MFSWQLSEFVFSWVVFLLRRFCYSPRALAKIHFHTNYVLHIESFVLLGSGRFDEQSDQTQDQNGASEVNNIQVI